MKAYDRLFAAAVLIALVGVVMAVLRQPQMEKPMVIREPAKPAPVAAAVAPTQPPPVDEPLQPPPPPPQAEAAAPAPVPIAPPPEEKSRRQMILGSWTTSEGDHTVTLTFNADGSMGLYSPQMPSGMQVNATYTWDSDDRITFNVSMTGPNGESMSHSTGMNIVELTENRLVVTDDQSGQQKIFTR